MYGIFAQDFPWCDVEGAGCIDVAADEAIFRRLLQTNMNNKHIRLLLGAWHTSKAMAATLIAIFSGYGIFKLASVLGVCFFDKLEKVTDYSATCRVLELIWVAVGVAVIKHCKEKNIKPEDIHSAENPVLYVWYLFFVWAGFWVGHKIGIRLGNYNMQIDNLSAFAPLFAVAGRSNYAQSTTHFLSYLYRNPALQTILSYVASVNLTERGHYFGFDEALERFGVLHVKQSLSRSIGGIDDLKAKIRSVQSERERLNLLLSEYVSDKFLIQSKRNTQSRKEVLWKLINELRDAFSHDNPCEHRLFIDTTQNTSEGFHNITTCYNIGIHRLIDIHAQEVERSKPVCRVGRRKRNVVINKFTSSKKGQPKSVCKHSQKKLKRHNDTNNTDNYPEGYINECTID